MQSVAKQRKLCVGGEKLDISLSWIRKMHEKIFNCQVIEVTFLESWRRRLRRTCGERRLREENIAQNP